MEVEEGGTLLEEVVVLEAVVVTLVAEALAETSSDTRASFPTVQRGRPGEIQRFISELIRIINQRKTLNPGSNQASHHNFDHDQPVGLFF